MPNDPTSTDNPRAPIWFLSEGEQDITFTLKAENRDRVLDLQVIARQDYETAGDPKLHFQLLVNGREIIKSPGEVFATDRPYQCASVPFVLKQTANKDTAIRIRYHGSKMKFQGIYLSGSERGTALEVQA